MVPISPRSSVPFPARAAVAGLSAALFTVSLFFPVLQFQGVNGLVLHDPPLPGFDPTMDVWNGVTALLMGILGPFAGAFAAYSNPFLWLAWILLLRDRIQSATVFAALAALISLHTFALFHTSLPVDEGGGGRHQILVRIFPAAWLWFASIALPLAAGALWWRRQLPPVLPPPPVAAPPLP